MKKSLTKLLARMAKDGDVEAVAEFIEEMIEGEPINGSATGASAAEAVAEVVEEVAEAAAEPEVKVETPEGTEITVDEDTVSGIIERLDRLIELLTPAPAATDEDPEDLSNAESTGLCAEEVAEVIEEVIEAVEAGEAAEATPEANAVEEVAEIVEAILEPEISTTLEEVIEGDEDPDDSEETCARDALRAALHVAGPRLAKMSRKERRKAAADIAARFQKTRRKGANRGYDHASQSVPAKDSDKSYNALGKRIMAARNANYHK